MPASHFPLAERLARLRLARTDGIGPITFRALIARFGTGVAAAEAVPLLARRGGRTKPMRLASKAQVEAEIKTLQRLGAAHVFLDDAGYPPLLSAIDDAPPVLIIRGHPALTERRCIGVVGARNASAPGRRLARDIAAALGAADITIVSGLARGIDAAAHEGSLATGTVAVLAGGIDIVYPRDHAELQDQVAAQGLLVTEAAPGTEPMARHFPRRNRIIAGLSLGVLVVEAAERSGSLITARLAGEYGREVFAVPGSPLDPRAKGGNKLLREGAVLTETAADILDALAGDIAPLAETDRDYSRMPLPPAEPSDAERRCVQELLSPVPVTIDALIQESGLTAPVVLTILLELELAGSALRLPGGKVSLS
ncbi:MAG: DNA-processing protein DprA [Rhodothalassiaceae bacterium]